uniref:PABS domain-containing protein n=1 Tax=Haemonchus contortus TaxID=6289 RepID=A0A7I4YRT2_HAECO
MDKTCKESVLAGFQRIMPETRSRITKSFFILMGFFCIAILIFIVRLRPKSCTNLNDRRIDRMCTENSDHCFNVYVAKMPMREKDVVVRVLAYDGRQKLRAGLIGDTAVLIRPPGGEQGPNGISRCLDYRKWLADHTAFVIPYIASMVAATFVMKSLSLHENDKDKQVLAIGLGGGSFDMGLHRIKPHVNITAVELEPVVIKLASKWFGVVDSETHHTVLQDGIKFVDDSISQGRKYDVVALDACGELSDTVICPAKPFQNLDTLEKIKNILTPTGSLVVNLLSMDRSAYGDYGWTKVLKLFQSVFKTCVLLAMHSTTNTVVACTPFSFPYIPNLMEYFGNRLSAVISTLHLNVIDNRPYITLLSAK